MGVHSCVLMVVSVAAMGTGAKRKMVIFVIFVILKCDLPPITSEYQYGYHNLPCSFLDQFMPILYD